MPSFRTSRSLPYSPLHFLSALGAGGLSVSFFMYLLWLTPHPGDAIPSFASLSAAWQTGDMLVQTALLVGVTGIALFAALHIWLVIWNILRFRAFSTSDAMEKLLKSNSETQLMALPLTLAMSINVGFILGAVFVPGLWDVREMLFPLALIGFAGAGFWAARLFLRFISRVFAEGSFDCAHNNSFAQLLSAFTFAMVGVGFSAAAAISHIKPVVAIGFVGAVLFLCAAGLLALVGFILGFRAMLENGAAAESSPTLWIGIPILTVSGIAIYRLKMALAHSFATPVTHGEIFSFLLVIVSLQVVLAAFGWAVMRRLGYFERWVSGDEASAGSYALICPGVAMAVSGHFLLHAGIMKIDLVSMGSLAHLMLLLPLVVLQAVTITTFFTVNRKVLPATQLPALALHPAE